MAREQRSRWQKRAIPLAALTLAGLLAASFSAQAQRRGGFFFDQLFGPVHPYYQQEERAPADYSRAPPPHKSETTPTTSVVVLGDAMADWLASGLEDAFSDSPEIGIVRRHKTYSGLLRYDQRSDLEWPSAARDILAKDRADYVVIMLGLSDRSAIREAPPKPAPKKNAKDKEKSQDKNAAEKSAEKSDQNKTAQEQKADDEGDQSIVAPEPQHRGGPAEFRTERWAELYSKKIDDMIAAAKSKGVPVIWVGLPTIRGTRSTSEAAYLNDLYRGRAEKAGIIYVDVWDGFVDETGKYTNQGPDVEGQTRRLRSYDGVYFTKFGARKLAHYVERELRRMMSSRAVPVALPTEVPQAPAAASGPVSRPVAGPVVPLAAVPAGSEQLLGGGSPFPANSDPVAARVLTKGETLSPERGRADDFSWPRGKPEGAEPTPTLVNTDPATTPAAQTGKRTRGGKTEQAKPGGKDKTQEKAHETKPGNGLRPPAPVRAQQQQQRPASRGPFGWLR